jgi:hypothetical protein
MRLGAPLAGALTGVVISGSGGLPAGLSGAVGGVMVSESFRSAGEQLESGLLGPREQERVGAALSMAAKLIQERLDVGDEIRSDGFFDREDGGRGASDEILEGMLRKAAAAYEEKKLPFIAALYANLAFSPDVPVAEGHYALQAADRLTFRQFCFLGLLTAEAHEDDVSLIARALTEVRGIDLPGITRGAQVEMGGLANEGLVGYRLPPGEVVHPASTTAKGQINSDDVRDLAPTLSGILLSSLMSLDRTRHEDVESALAELAGDPEWRLKAR